MRRSTECSGWRERSVASGRQVALFAGFLEVSGLLTRWRAGACRMACSTSPDAPEAVDVLGTWLQSILDGQRYLFKLKTDDGSQPSDPAALAARQLAGRGPRL